MAAAFEILTLISHKETAWKIDASPKALLKAMQYAAESKFCSKKKKK
jgi:hypothetical protein